MKTSLKKSSEVELEIDSLAFGGKGLARLDGFVVFVDQALPGQRLLAKIIKKKKDYAEARPLQILAQSKSYVEPRCSHFEDCGGCLLQNLKYEEQLAAKTQQVVDILERIAGIPNPIVHPAIGSPERFFYRNKMEFSFSRQRWLTRAEIASDAIATDRDFALGLHARRRYDKTLAIDECFLLSERSNRILKIVREATKGHSLLPYTTQDHTGFWRFLVMREGKRTDELMVNIVTADRAGGKEAVAKLSEHLVQQAPEITTVVHNINRSKAQVAFGEEEVVLFGPGYLRDRIGDYTFQISASSFFQTNTLGAEKLYELALQFASLSGDETVYDLYSGAGTISIYISSHAKQVVGFELIPQAIRDAGVNCRLNQIDNCSFIEGDLKDELAQVPVLINRWGKPDVIVIDPPRAGMHPKVIRKVLRLAPQRIVYISCNPGTFARDVKDLKDKYQLEKVQPVDMFPHTAHCEVVGLLVRI